MPDTRPGIKFDEEGVCSACRSYEHRATVDWNARWKELEKICDKYRGMNGPNGYDCIIAVSGGKDSHYQVYVMKELMHMNPLLISAGCNMPMTKAGEHNVQNIGEVFGCDLIMFKPNASAEKKVMRYTFEKYGKPLYFQERCIYTYPLHMAVKFNLPLIVYGENVSWEYGGVNGIETYSGRDMINNGVACGIPTEEICRETGVSMKELNFFSPPSMEEMKGLDPIYTSYFVQWDSFKNYEIAKKYGFHDLTHEWERTHHIEQFDQIDIPAYLVHSWMKYPKFGHQAATDYASRMVRYGMITREEGFKLIDEHDGNLDPRCVREFCDFLGYSEHEFWEIIDRQYNKDIFEKNSQEQWVLKKVER